MGLCFNASLSSEPSGHTWIVINHQVLYNLRDLLQTLCLTWLKHLTLNPLP